MSTPDDVARAAEAAWPAAQARWSRFLGLRPPAAGTSPVTVAWLDLRERQVSLDHARIASLGLVDAVEALLAHEVGHHVRWPGTLATQARLRVMERVLLPLPDYSLVNLFTDMLINELLGRDPLLREQLIRTYRAFPLSEEGWKTDPAFSFVLAVYEALWELPAGDLIGRAWPTFSEAFPHHRAEAALLAQDLFVLGPNVFTQWLFFLSIVLRYVKPLTGEVPQATDPHGCQRAEPSAEDLADALHPSAREREAVKRARRWFDPTMGRALDDLLDPESRIRGLPQSLDDASRVPEVMAAWYRLQAERWLLRPPPQRRQGEAIVPTTAEAWEPGDPVHDIDWRLTLLESGDELGPARPLRRTPVAEEEGHDVPLWQPRIEIWQDVSGSMPDPRHSLNPMTLAAQILITGATRAQGRARVVLYSHTALPFQGWSRSETELSRFLMHYIGGGTAFPFDLLQASVRQCGREQPIRVVISDRDFEHNHDADPHHPRILDDAVRASPRFILLLLQPRPEYVTLWRGRGITVVAVAGMDHLPRVATDLARALFPEGDDAR